MGQGALSPRSQKTGNEGASPASYPKQVFSPAQPPNYNSAPTGAPGPFHMSPRGGTSGINGAFRQFENAFDRLDQDITDSMDGTSKRFYNQVRDNSIPPPPGHASTSQTFIVQQPMMMPYPVPQASPFVPMQQEQPPLYTTVYPGIDEKEKKINEMETGLK